MSPGDTKGGRSPRLGEGNDPTNSRTSTNAPGQDSGTSKVTSQSGGARALAVASSPYDGHNKAWKQLDPMTWAELVAWLKLDEPAGDKKCGAYVLGTVDGRARNTQSVKCRSALALDIDKLTPPLLEAMDAALDLVLGWQAVAYATHSSTAEAPRRRVIVALSRDVTPEEYRRVARWAMRAIGLPETAYDVSASTSPVQLMLRPAAGDPDAYASTVYDGEPIDVEKALEATPVESTAPQSETSAEELSEPPTTLQLAKASAVLEKAVREIAELRLSDGSGAAGRNDATVRWLIPLFGFAKADCLDREDVEERLFAAVSRVPGVDAFTRAEFDTAAGNAWRIAKPTRPDVSDVEDDFDPLPPIETEYGEIEPGNYVERGRDGRGLLVKSLAEAVSGYLTHAYGSVDGRFWLYRGGVWVPDRREIGKVVYALMGEDFSPGHLSAVKEALRYTHGAREIDCGPIPKWVNVPNGLLDWRTRELHPHTPDVLSTVQLPVEWNPDAECPAFEQFLREVLPADCIEPTEGGPGFIWELLGYLVYSGNPHHIATLLRGKGRNGKGVFLRVVNRVLGVTNVTAVTLHDLVENRFRSADLFGKIANIAGDLDPKWMEGTGKFKAITGEDPISAERKYGDTFDFTPWAVPVYSANKGFGSPDSSEGYFARWVVVPFPNTFLGREDRGLDARLGTRSELEGVLRRAVEAIPYVMERGRLPQPESIRQAKHEFMVAGDQIRAWLDEECQLDPNAWTERTVLFRAYQNWITEAGRGGMSKQEFYARLEQVGGLVSTKRQGTRGLLGVRVK